MFWRVFLGLSKRAQQQLNSYKTSYKSFRRCMPCSVSPCSLGNTPPPSSENPIHIYEKKPFLKSTFCPLPTLQATCSSFSSYVCRESRPHSLFPNTFWGGQRGEKIIHIVRRRYIFSGKASVAVAAIIVGPAQPIPAQPSQVPRPT